MICSFVFKRFRALGLIHVILGSSGDFPVD